MYNIFITRMIKVNNGTLYIKEKRPKSKEPKHNTKLNRYKIYRQLKGKMPH